MNKYLVEGEAILARAGDLYASNMRLLRYKKHLGGEEFDDIPYSHITSIGVVRHIRRSLVRSGIIIAVIGLSTLLTLITVKRALDSVSGLFGNAAGALAMLGIPSLDAGLASWLAPLIPFSIVVLTGGIVMAVWGIFRPESFIQFRAPGLNRETEAKFRLGGVQGEASLELVRVVRQQSLAVAPEPKDAPLPVAR